ncbi:Vacuolar morphogenesis protein 6 [Arthrobotrys musiformis]|uniref:Vacuolar morphogenesis protein 6 n=1 Tax=Arthrobotrys musiformis TaxID=47236 RepID=A0AAV9WAI3_9PEZI
MLTAFHARSIRELSSKDRSRQECILAYGEKLLVGLNNGTLRIYRVSNPTTPTEAIDIECLREVEGFTKRPINQMGCIKESSILVILADTYVSTYDMASYEKLETLSKTRGATLFALTSGVERDLAGVPSVVSRLAVVVKRKLLLYLWKDGEFHDSNEITLPSQPRSLTWAAEGKLCAGLSSSFAMVDVNTEVVEDIPMAGGGGGAGGYLSWSTRNPLATRLGDDELLLVRDSTSMYISARGDPLESKQIPWTHPPDQLGYSYPYLVSLHPHNTLQIRNPDTQNLLQTITLPGATLLHTPQHNHALSHAGKQFYLASPTQIWKMVLVDYGTQIKELTAKGEYDEAISILEQIEQALFVEKEERIKEIQMLKAEKLFSMGKFRDSMDLFAKVAAPPARVIRLYPPAVAGEISNQIVEEVVEEPAPDKPVQQSEENGLPPAEEVKQNGEGEDKSSPTEEQAPGTPPKENGNHPSTPDVAAPRSSYFSIPARLKLSSAAAADDTASIRSGKSGKGDSEAAAALPSAANTPPPAAQAILPPPPTNKLEGKVLKLAVQGLVSYLVEMRRKLLKYVKPDMDPDALGESAVPTEDVPTFGDAPSKSAIDFSEVAALLPPSRHGGEMTVKEQLEGLMEMAKLIDTTLLRSYMFTNSSLVGPLVRVENFCDPEVVHEKLVETGRFKELVDYLANKKLHDKALVLLKSFGDREEPDEREPDLHGPQATATYLQKLHADQLPLIFEYSTWVLHKDPKLGMEVFVDDTPQVESLPRDKVLDFLKSIDVRLGVEYAEHLVHELKDDSPDYHNWLIEGYLTMMKETKEAGEDGWGWKLSPEQREEFGVKVLKFTEESHQYWPEKVIRWLPKDDPTFYEIRASILSRLGEHKQALEIFVFRMQDFSKAEAYCNRIHQLSPPTSDPAETSTETVYSILLSLYLRPPPNYEVQMPPALDLLSRHGARVDPLESLKLIPESIKVADLQSYFENRIRHSNSRVNMNRVMAQLYKSEAFRWEELNAEAKKKAVVIGEERVCPVCHKRLGKSVISVFPDGQVVHYGCANRAAGRKGIAEVKEEIGLDLGLRRGFGGDRWGASATGGWR